MHSLIKIALGPTLTQLVKVKSGDDKAIEDQVKQLEKWVEHYSKPYAQDLPEHLGIELFLLFHHICGIA